MICRSPLQVFDELASNARRHGQAPRLCRVTLCADRPRVRIEVDAIGPGDPQLRTPDATGGRGMMLIDRLSTTWACTRHHGRKTVWAEVPLEPAPATRSYRQSNQRLGSQRAAGSLSA
ncbi:hypothetical protein ABIA39_007479 [Nocardia sp. GAS34]|uniref:ATP-binding protein n=1 Tax=unclassified Nocardia TaxID=2637762 RepID=UPI003D1D61DE